MTSPVLLIFATRYDEVTRRTHSVAQRLLADAEGLSIATLALFEAAATEAQLVGAVAARPRVIALYSHGNTDGQVLAQDRSPCWTATTIPDLAGIAVFAHACRGICWLKGESARHNAELLVGYEEDLFMPANGSPRFWECYEEVHSFVPRHLAAMADEAWIQIEFYGLCTKHFGELNGKSAPLMELLAIQQARDDIQFAHLCAS